MEIESVLKRVFSFRGAFAVLSLFLLYACSEQAIAEGTENIAQNWQAERTSLEETDYVDSAGISHKALVLTILEPGNLTKTFSDYSAIELTALFYVKSIPFAYQNCDVLQITILKGEREISGRVNISDARYASDCFYASNPITEQIKKGNTYNFEGYFRPEFSADSTVSRVKLQLEHLFETVDPSVGFSIYGFTTDTSSTKLYFNLHNADTSVFCQLDFTAKGKQLKNLFLSPNNFR